MDIYLAIRKAIELQGETIIREDRLVNILSDFHCFPSDSSYRHIFKMLYASDCMYNIYSIWKSAEKKEEHQMRFEIQKLTQSISKRYALRYDKVQFCIESVFLALNLISTITTFEDDLDNHIPIIVGLWNFHFKENKEMILEIRRDGCAIASSGTKYHWQISDGQFVLFIEDLVYYRGQIENDTIMGIAYSNYNPLGWEWFATKRNDGLTINNLESGIWIIINDVSDLEDNYIRFLPNNILESSLYGIGNWSLDDDKLVIVTANNFIKYEASLSKGKIIGKGRNKLSNEWNFELKKRQ